MSLLPRQEADMAFRPYRQQDASDHMEARKHQGYPPCKRQTRGRSASGGTSSRCGEDEAGFF